MKSNQRVKSMQFGILAKVYRDAYSNLYIESNAGKKLKMTTKFPRINFIEQKALKLVGKQVAIYTSKTTGDWSSSEYFCDIEAIAKGNTNSIHPKEDDIFWSDVSGKDLPF
ncbi:hypothetical protein G3R49_00415 [Shewanella sp. WXL01]|uniref:Uncharacterized protein n=1 Tax=Shewanella maritima TaxID=2520507 RepID=A0A411PH41_9GAMM|nr:MULTISPECIES: hypothetical protein [Shewanella]NKF49038.1 hypothetical protein [Shewanella sp. WXL01]QBF82818.1 hypothetical protein EXU30_09025 [Shewanella maritima]